jgi:hypothetical protein
MRLIESIKGEIRQNNLSARKQHLASAPPLLIMSSPITEVVVLTLHPGTKPEEPMKGLSSILHRQPGFQQFRWWSVGGIAGKSLSFSSVSPQ